MNLEQARSLYKERIEANKLLDYYDQRSTTAIAKEVFIEFETNADADLILKDVKRVYICNNGVTENRGEPFPEFWELVGTTTKTVVVGSDSSRDDDGWNTTAITRTVNAEIWRITADDIFSDENCLEKLSGDYLHAPSIRYDDREVGVSETPLFGYRRIKYFIYNGNPAIVTL